MQQPIPQGGQHGLVEEWVAAISEQFCPFIRPSEMEKVLHFRSIEYASLGNLREEREEQLFNLALVETEKLRKERRALATAKEALKARMLCTNIVVLGTEALSWREAKNVLDWPHFLLKKLYSDVGVMFGKFWTGETTNSLHGRPIPPPPICILSIRSAIVVRDPDLLAGGDFAHRIHNSQDDGVDVLLPHSLNVEPLSSLAERLTVSELFFKIRIRE